MTVTHYEFGEDELDYSEWPYAAGVVKGQMGWQTNLVVISDPTIGFQSEMNIEATPAQGFQASLNILEALKPTAWQTDPIILAAPARGFQALQVIPDDDKARGFQFSIADHMHTILQSGYASGEYGMGDYLAPGYAVPLGWQATMQNTQSLAMQFNTVIYNVTQLRILCDFPSRGTTGSNWSTTSSAGGDLLINNVNTDIVEQVYRSVTGVTSVTIDCDTQISQGVFLDTMAFMNHNLTTSATITMVGSNNSGHSPAGVTIPITVTVDDLYYLAPELPNSGYRYWRFVIDDSGNPNNYIEIGTIVFGQSIVFTTDENYVTPVRKARINFVDTVFTEGYTNVSNDRGVKKKISLDFRYINYDGGNYEALQDVYETARTVLKCLWIPYPSDPKRFAVFAKLTEIPEETHDDRGSAGNYVDFTISLDEST